MNKPRVNNKLNLVIPIETDDGTVFVHSTPLRRDIFEKYFLIISKTFTAIYSEGLNVIAGPRIAFLMLKRIAQESNAWEGTDGIENGLINEIRRITNILIPSISGWALRSYQEVISKQVLSEDDIAEIEGYIVFFICASAIHRKEELNYILENLANLWGIQITSLNCTEYSNSLQTSIKPETSVETAKPLSLPG